MKTMKVFSLESYSIALEYFTIVKFNVEQHHPTCVIL